MLFLFFSIPKGVWASMDKNWISDCGSANNQVVKALHNAWPVLDKQLLLVHQDFYRATACQAWCIRSVPAELKTKCPEKFHKDGERKRA